MIKDNYLFESGSALGLVDSLKRVGKHTFIYGLGSVIGNVISFFLVPVYTRFLTTADYGVLSSMTALDACLTIIIALGLHGAAFRFYFEENNLNKKELLGSIWLFQMLVALVISLVLYLFSGKLALIIFREPQMSSYIKLVVVRVFLSIGSLLPLVLLRAKEKSLHYTIFILLTALAGVCFNVYFVVFLKKGALGSLQAGVITAGIIFIPYLWIMAKEIAVSLNKSIIIRSLAFGLPLVPHLLANWALNLSDRILLQRLSSEQELGLYALGCNLTLVLSLIVISINNAWSPFYYSIAQKQNGPAVISKLISYYLLFLVFAVTGISIFAKEIVVVMSAPNYILAYTVIPPLALSYLFMGAYFMSVNGIFLKNQTKFLPFLTSSAAAANIVLNLLWIPRFGMIGAAWATVIAFALLFGGTYFISNRLFAVEYERARIAKIMLSALLVYLLARMVRQDSIIYSACLKLPVLFSYVIILYLLRFFTQEEINELKALTRKFRIIK